MTDVFPIELVSGEGRDEWQAYYPEKELKVERDDPYQAVAALLKVMDQADIIDRQPFSAADMLAEMTGVDE